MVASCVSSEEGALVSSISVGAGVASGGDIVGDEEGAETGVIDDGTGISCVRVGATDGSVVATRVGRSEAKSVDGTSGVVANKGSGVGSGVGALDGIVGCVVGFMDD